MDEAPENRNGNGERRADGTFAPGNRANPGGRPKGLAAAVREVYPAKEIVAGMVKIAKGLKIAGQKPSVADMVRAREWLADRGYGKAAAFAALEGGDPLDLGNVDGAIEDALDELAGRREAKTVGESSPPAVAGEGQGAAGPAG